MVEIRAGEGEPLHPTSFDDVELYHPRSWLTKYVFSQDAKIIAIQYAVTAISIGVVALVAAPPPGELEERHRRRGVGDRRGRDGRRRC